MILILGGNGFVGQHVAANLIEKGERVVVSSHSRPAPILLSGALDKGAAVVEKIDTADPFSMMAAVAKHRPKTIIDITGHPPKALAPAADVRFRVNGQLNLLEAARIYEVPRIVLTSSMDAYWGLGAESIPFQEDATVPLLEMDDHFIVQSWVKKSLEVIGNLYRRQAGMEIIFVRSSGVYGPLYRTLMHVPSRLAHAAAGRLDLSSDPLPVAEDGYDQAYVKDIAEGMALVALANSLSHAVYNIGSGGAPLYSSFAAAARKAVPSFDVILPSRSGSGLDAPSNPMSGRWQDISRAKAELGYAPSYDVDRAMEDYIRWLRDNPL